MKIFCIIWYCCSFLLDLARANSFVLEECGLNGNYIDTLNRCSTEPDFFSFRRDNGKTGRMWSVIMR